TEAHALLHYIAYATSGEFSGEELAPANGVALANAPPPPSVTISVAQDPHAPPTFDAYTDGDRFQWMVVSSVGGEAYVLSPLADSQSRPVLDFDLPRGLVVFGIQAVSREGRVNSFTQEFAVDSYWRAVNLGTEFLSEPPEPWIGAVGSNASISSADQG